VNDSESVIDRIFDQAEVNDNYCWIYRGSATQDGYGQIYSNSGNYLTHRVAFAHHHKITIQQGLRIHHTCFFYRRCFRWDHLQLVTPQMDCLMKPDFITARKERLLKLLAFALHGELPSITTTQLAHILAVQRSNVPRYLASIRHVYDSFEFELIRAGRGNRPSLYDIYISPGLIAELQDTSAQQGQPAFSPWTPAVLQKIA
jgi:hypothetical protein